MPEKNQKKTAEKLSKFKEDFAKKSFKYPEAPQMQARPAGAEVEQPPAKQKKKSND